MDITLIIAIATMGGLGFIFAGALAIADKKLIDVAVNEITSISGQKPITTYSKKDISNFKLRKGMPIGIKVTLRRNKMYEFLERLISISLPRIRDFRGIEHKFDGQGNYSLGILSFTFIPKSNKTITTKIATVSGINCITLPLLFNKVTSVITIHRITKIVIINHKGKTS